MGQDRYTRDINHQYRGDPFRTPSLWPSLDTNVDDTHRYLENSEVRRPPIPIERALREHCNIPGKHFFVASIGDDGRANFFTSASCKILPATVATFFSKDAFEKSMSSASSVSTPVVEEDLGFDDAFQYSNEFGRRWNNSHRYNLGPETLDEEGNPKARKRMRSSTLRMEEAGDDDGPVPTVSCKKFIRVEDESEILAFYEQRFKNCQQTACKLIAKAWIKLVEPKKQSTHPYTGKDEKAPEWWPQPWGDTKEEKVRHKEPDHLYKRERVHLLCHILRMIVQPNDHQHRNIRKLNLNVSKLEECTYDALSTFFTDKDNPPQARKKPYLQEIFKVARQEQRYRGGEIDPGTKIYVMADDRIPENWTSDNEAASSFKEEDEEVTPAPPTSATQKGLAVNALIATQSNSDHSPAAQMASAPYLTEMPVRGGAYSQQLMGAELPAEQTHYVEGNPISGQTAMHPANSLPMHDIFHGPHDTGRRPSMFPPPGDYTSPATPTIYSGGWQPGTAPPSNPAMYSFQPPQAGSHQPFVGQHTVQIQHGQQYMGSNFDGLPRGGHVDPNHGQMYRPASLGQNPSQQGSAYPGYPASSIKLEAPRNPIV